MGMLKDVLATISARRVILNEAKEILRWHGEKSRSFASLRKTDRGISTRAGVFPHARPVVLLILTGLLTLHGCGKKEPPDPIEYVKSLIPVIEEGLNRRDIAGLKKLGTTKFEANAFINDVFSRGVEGNVAFHLKRVRHVTGEVSLTLQATFGQGGRGGEKELKIQFVGEHPWRIDAYWLVDKRLPGQPATPPSDAPPDTTQPS